MRSNFAPARERVSNIQVQRLVPELARRLDRLLGRVEPRAE